MSIIGKDVIVTDRLIKHIEGLKKEVIEYLTPLVKNKKCLIAYSGGKDSIVVSHILKELGHNNCVCETSFLYPKDLENFKLVAKIIELDVDYKNSLSYEWLDRNLNYVFPEPKTQSKFYAIRQHTTIKNKSKSGKYDIVITGRRDEENSVKDRLYTTKDNIQQLHPLKTWKTTDIWLYINYYKVPYPEIYNTLLGDMDGAAPWVTKRRKQWLKSPKPLLEALEEYDVEFYNQVIKKYV